MLEADLAPLLDHNITVQHANEDPITGLLWSHENGLIVLAQDAPQPSFFIAPAASLTLVTDAGPSSAVAPDPAPPSPRSQTKKLTKAIQAASDHKTRSNTDASPEAQRFFDALHRIYPVRWDGLDIVILDDVVISPPYSAEDIQSSLSGHLLKVVLGERNKAFSSH